jgi:hypothetical protein
MVIRRESFVDTSLPHKYEAHRIAEGVALVDSSLKKLHPLSVEAFIYPNRFHKRMFQDSAHEIENGLSRKFTSLGQGHEFHQHVIVHEFSALLLKEAPCLFMLGLIAVVVTKKS